MRVGLSERDALRSGIRTRAGDREHDARDRAQAGRYGRRRRCQRPQLLDDQAGGRSGRGRRYDVRLPQRGDPAARWAIGSCGPELAATTTGDIGREKDGSGRLAIRRSNTDQEGEGAGCYLPPATMTAAGPEARRRDRRVDGRRALRGAGLSAGDQVRGRVQTRAADAQRGVGDRRTLEGPGMVVALRQRPMRPAGARSGRALGGSRGAPGPAPACRVLTEYRHLAI